MGNAEPVAIVKMNVEEYPIVSVIHDDATNCFTTTAALTLITTFELHK
jgi:hypothetical protein